MVIVAFTFVVVLGIVLGAYFALVVRPESFERSTLLRRLGSKTGAATARAVQLERPEERLSNVRAVQAMLSRATGVSGPLERLVTQSGLKITVGTGSFTHRIRCRHGNDHGPANCWCGGRSCTNRRRAQDS